MEKKFLCLEDIGAYKISFDISNFIWKVVLQWNYLAKDTVGSQFIRAADSISANIAEGFGRYHKKDKIKFYRYSLGSLWESRDWNEKAFLRNLITQEVYDHITLESNKLPREINYLIKYTNEKLTM